MAKKTISSDEAKSLVGATDWTRVKSLTDSQIEEAARQDRTAPLLKTHELKQFKRGSLNDKK